MDNSTFTTVEKVLPSTDSIQLGVPSAPLPIASTGITVPTVVSESAGPSVTLPVISTPTYAGVAVANLPVLSNTASLTLPVVPTTVTNNTVPLDTKPKTVVSVMPIIQPSEIKSQTQLKGEMAHEVMEDDTIQAPELNGAKSTNGDIITLGLPIYFIASPWSLKTLDTFLLQYGEVGSLRVIYDSDGRETNNTIAVISESSYDELYKAGYGMDNKQVRRNFSITPFTLKKNSLPALGKSKTLFVPVPNKISDDETYVNDVIEGKLNFLAKWQIIPDKSWDIKSPLKSRERGGVKGGCFISFKDSVPLKQIAAARIILTDTYWDEDDQDANRPVFKCFWAHERKEHLKTSKFNKYKQNSENVRTRQHQQSSEGNKYPKPGRYSNRNNKSYQKRAPTIPIAAQPTLKKED